MKRLILVLAAILLTMPLLQSQKKPDTLRFLYWNIQNGMWYDQDEKYKTFVAVVKKSDPYVCVCCEGENLFNRHGVKLYG